MQITPIIVMGIAKPALFLYQERVYKITYDACDVLSRYLNSELTEQQKNDDAFVKKKIYDIIDNCIEYLRKIDGRLITNMLMLRVVTADKINRGKAGESCPAR